MKLRRGFVSNSSSSSFVITKKGLSKKQLQQLDEYFEKYREGEFEEGYPITGEKFIFGDISYHADPDLKSFLESINVPEDNYEID